MNEQSERAVAELRAVAAFIEAHDLPAGAVDVNAWVDSYTVYVDADDDIARWVAVLGGKVRRIEERREWCYITDGRGPEPMTARVVGPHYKPDESAVDSAS